MDWEAPGRAELCRAMERVLTITECAGPEQPDGRGNLLARYIDDWRRDRIGQKYRSLGGHEEADIVNAVIEAATRLAEEARRLTGIPPRVCQVGRHGAE